MIINKGEIYMNINKVDFLNDLGKTIDFLRSNINVNDKIIKLQFYTTSNVDDYNVFDVSYNSLDEIELENEDYQKVKKITMVLMNNNNIKTIHCDKETSMVAITDNTKKETKVNSMINESNLNNIIKDDGCTYYEFEFGQIGKYDPKTLGYYLYDDDRWILSGTVMRWVEDSQYEYKIIKQPTKISSL